jgi:lincosamide nucleotidyltransferase A/C/D/E
MNKQDAIELLTAIENLDIDVYLDGGWGVDALLGRQTRVHNDIDIFIEVKHTATITEFLRSRGFREIVKDFTTAHHTEWHDDIDRTIDLHLFEQKDKETLVFEYNEYSAEVFQGRGKIGDMNVRCLTAEAQVAFHQGYEHDENDKRDVLALCEKFNIPVPKQYKD